MLRESEPQHFMFEPLGECNHPSREVAPWAHLLDPTHFAREYLHSDEASRHSSLYNVAIAARTTAVHALAAYSVPVALIAATYVLSR